MKGPTSRTRRAGRILICVALASSMLLPMACAEPGLPGAEEVRAIARNAYVYGYPMVMNYKTMYEYAIDTQGPDYKGPFNQVSCEARLFTPDDRAVVTPNADTPYCMFWMDLRAEPLVLSVPGMEPDRYYSFQLIDLYTHNFAYVGTLTTGNDAGDFLLAGPAWAGQAPEGMAGVLRSETDFIFNVTRTQLFGPDDLGRVEEIQGQYRLQPLSAFLGEDAPAPAPRPDFPQWVEGAQSDERFFSYLDFTMDLLGRPGPGEDALWRDLARLGLGPDHDFDPGALPDELRQALRQGVEDGKSDIADFVAKYSDDPLASGKLFGTREFLRESASVNYDLDAPDMLRTVGAYMGLYGNSAAEAIYPTFLVDADGDPLNGASHAYRLTFPPEGLPPVKAFWSLTMYDGRTQLFIENPLGRYLLNSEMMDQFEREADGSVVLYVGAHPPDGASEANWLPAPEGPFYMVMRLYGPEAAALEGRWMPPEVRKND